MNKLKHYIVWIAASFLILLNPFLFAASSNGAGNKSADRHSARSRAEIQGTGAEAAEAVEAGIQIQENGFPETEKVQRNSSVSEKSQKSLSLRKLSKNVKGIAKNKDSKSMDENLLKAIIFSAAAVGLSTIDYILLAIIGLGFLIPYYLILAGVIVLSVFAVIYWIKFFSSL